MFPFCNTKRKMVHHSNDSLPQQMLTFRKTFPSTSACSIAWKLSSYLATNHPSLYFVLPLCQVNVIYPLATVVPHFSTILFLFLHIPMAAFTHQLPNSSHYLSLARSIVLLPAIRFLLQFSMTVSLLKKKENENSENQRWNANQYKTIITGGCTSRTMPSVKI